MTATASERNRLLEIVLVGLSIVSLFLDRGSTTPLGTLVLINLIDVAILTLLIREVVGEYSRHPYKLVYLRRNAASLAFTALFIAMFVWSKIDLARVLVSGVGSVAAQTVALRTLFLVLKVGTRFRRLAAILEDINSHPAQTVVLSFGLVIVAGALLLMMPFTSASGVGLSALDAIFTATSAVCVTGLIVVDTVSHFSTAGQIVLMALIQIGGLGIMVLTFFTVFIAGGRASIEDAQLITFMVSESDTRKIRRAVAAIVGITIGVQAVGAALLYVGFGPAVGSRATRVFYAVFHSVSAFCNAGFALFSDSLESLSGNPVVLLTIAFLIIAGGIGFGVMTNLWSVLASWIRRLRRSHGRVAEVSLNTRVVLAGTAVLVVAGTLLIYAFEHGNGLGELPTGRQYLNAFFQSVTLRTAGFNSIALGALAPTTFVVMLVLMFVGGAGGGTAGGVKIGSVVVVGAHLRATARGSRQASVGRRSVSAGVILNAFVVITFGLGAIATGMLVLAGSESLPLEALMFEAVSAFGTVGLSVGITGSLTDVGKVTIVVLMFLGRLGPLTILSASSRHRRDPAIGYPEAGILVG